MNRDEVYTVPVKQLRFLRPPSIPSANKILSHMNVISAKDGVVLKMHATAFGTIFEVIVATGSYKFFANEVHEFQVDMEDIGGDLEGPIPPKNQAQLEKLEDRTRGAVVSASEAKAEKLTKKEAKKIARMTRAETEGVFEAADPPSLVDDEL